MIYIKITVNTAPNGQVIAQMDGKTVGPVSDQEIRIGDALCETFKEKLKDLGNAQVMEDHRKITKSKAPASNN
jgi:hypothetical protein